MARARFIAFALTGEGAVASPRGAT